ncbi:MAG TPA: GNAT family N-acetyltransferase [Cyclobacteriaceae bacterium]
MLRPLEQKDNPAVRDIIRTVMPEFGASGKGFAIHDSEVEDMYAAYTQSRCSYFVWEENGKIYGGGGVAPLQGGDTDTCELKKMYFLPEGRGKGSGQLVLSQCLKAAKALGFKYCYLETFNTMTHAMKLYERNGFEKIAGPLGNTGHFSCDTFYKRSLEKL